MISSETLTILSQIIGKEIDPTEAEAIFQELNQDDPFSPAALVTGLIEKLQIRYDALADTEEVNHMLADILVRDRYTGFYIHPALRAFYLDCAMARAKLPDQQNRNFLVLGDFMNLSNVNEAIGRSTTNDVMATICGIYLHCMTQAGVVNWLFYRSMGDEITFIIMDTDQRAVEKGLEDAARITNEFIQLLGIERLKHKKYPDQQGMGLITAHKALVADSDHRILKQTLEEGVKNKKTTHSKLSWFNKLRHGVEPGQYHNSSSEIRIDKALHKYKHFKLASTGNDETSEKLGVRNVLMPAKSLLIGRAIAWPRDDRIEYLRNHYDNSKIMIRADIYNLGGLNNVFGHDGADEVKAHLVRIIHATMVIYNLDEPKIFDCGGGIIDVVINAVPSTVLSKIIETLQTNIHHQILSMTVSHYATMYNLSFSGHGDTLLSELPHPKHDHKGTGLIMAMHLVESARSLPEIIERLDKITYRTKLNGFAYLWSTEDNRVYGYRLNEAAQPVAIGMDRMYPTKHYLPFTDALRHSMKFEDLPNIFERPVGQISETIFGTDMQAVLGFKKAIRLLQDHAVPDSEIQEIDSYDAMDLRLKQEGLPPLSVVSTQNRPVIVDHEPEYFRTMALAEKLEELPTVMVSLVLQAQASFRTLKLTQPHGRLPPSQVIHVLREEIGRFKLPKGNLIYPREQLAEALYSLARLLDYSFALVDKEISNSVSNSLHGLSFEILRDLVKDFRTTGELILAEKIRIYCEVYEETHNPVEIMLGHLEKECGLLIQKITKKSAFHPQDTNKLNDCFAELLRIIRGQAKRDLK
jgi:GGDEF domain-containing protein